MKPPPSATRADSFPVVGVGASAGGLDAFTRFLRHLPADPGLAILLVQHLDPSRPSLLTEILSRATTLPVHEAADGMPVEVDHVYVIPPDTRMSVAGGAIRLQPRGDPVPHHPVDFLFQSLAEAFGPRAVAVVLSGGGTDGTLGLGAVREAGGTTFAQDERSSGQTGMPASAVASGNVDVVLTPEGIADALIQLVQRPDLYRPAVPGVTEPPEGGEALAPLFALIRARTGIDFEQYKQNTIRRRVSRRLALRTLATVADLVRVAQDDPAELNALTRDLLIGVTRFFREPDTFDRFRQSAIPTLLRNRMPGTPLRVWVPGCSTGEEAYSLAIVLLEDLGDVEEVPVKILATDVNEQALALARTGVYPKNISADVSPHRLRRYFLEMSGGYRIRPSVRDLVVFARHDLTTDPPFARMDLISCRNVLIYFDTPLQRRVVPLFHYALRPGGFLLLGSSETIGLFPELFVPADPTARLYTRTLAPGRVPTNPAVGAPSWGRPSAVASRVDRPGTPVAWPTSNARPTGCSPGTPRLGSWWMRT